MPKPRDYRAEYERRIQRGLSAGLSRNQARRSGPRGRLATKGQFDRLLQNAVKDIAKGRFPSAKAAAREYRVNDETLRQYMRNTGQAERRGGRIVPRSSHRSGYHVPVYSNGNLYEIDVDRTNATLVGRYMHAVGQFIRTGDASVLEEFDDMAVTDLNGQNYTLETDPAVLTELHRFESVNWDAIYKVNG